MIGPVNRYELKYLIPVRQADRIRADLAEMTEPDPHSGPHGYRVVSLYHDSPDLDCFWAKIEGVRMRRKLRIRVYPDQDGRCPPAGFVEIKQRVNRTVRKRRLGLSLADAELLCAGEWPEAELNAEQRLVASEVQYLVRAMQLRPSALTAYRRQAYLGGGPGRVVRITLDQDCTGRVRELALDGRAVSHRLLPPDWCVMEVKVDEAVPDWVSSLLARHGCQLRRISKYCAALARGRGVAIEPLAVWPVSEEPVHG